MARPGSNPASQFIPKFWSIHTQKNNKVNTTASHVIHLVLKAQGEIVHHECNVLCSLSHETGATHAI